jgi:hypothetical protein
VGLSINDLVPAFYEREGEREVLHMNSILPADVYIHVCNGRPA